MKITIAQDECEYDTRELWKVVIGKKWVITAIGLSCAILIFLISYFVLEWRYESTTQIYLLSKEDSIAEVTYADLQVSSSLIKDYMILTTSRLVTKQVIKELGLDLKHEDLVKLIHVENPEETRILNIRVEYNNPVIAKKIADAVREATTSLITTLTDNGQISRIEEANISERPATPNIKRNTVLGGVLGVMVSAFIYVLRYLADNTIKTTKDIEKYLEMQVLCNIPIKNLNKSLIKRSR